MLSKDESEEPIKAQADMATDVSTPEPHIRIDIPNSVNDYPRVYVDGENISNGINRAVERVLIKYDTGTDTNEPKQSVNIKYIERDAGGKWSVKHYDESTMNLDDDTNA